MVSSFYRVLPSFFFVFIRRKRHCYRNGETNGTRRWFFFSVVFDCLFLFFLHFSRVFRFFRARANKLFGDTRSTRNGGVGDAPFAYAEQTPTTHTRARPNTHTNTHTHTHTHQHARGPPVLLGKQQTGEKKNDKNPSGALPERMGRSRRSAPVVTENKRQSRNRKRKKHKHRHWHRRTGTDAHARENAGWPSVDVNHMFIAVTKEKKREKKNNQPTEQAK